MSKGSDAKKLADEAIGLVMPTYKAPAGAIEDERVFRELMAISERSSKLPRRWATIAEFDAAEYDERGNCR
jgi:hypothetical protein